MCAILKVLKEKKMIYDVHEYYSSLIDLTKVDEIADAIAYILEHPEET